MTRCTTLGAPVKRPGRVRQASWSRHAKRALSAGVEQNLNWVLTKEPRSHVWILRASTEWVLTMPTQDQVTPATSVGRTYAYT